MNEKITFKMWLSVCFGGIWQFIRNIFSWKNKTPFWRVIWVTITVCILIVTGLICFSFIQHQRTYHHSCYPEDYDSRLSSDYKFRNNGTNSGKSYIYNARTKDKVLRSIDWIAVPEDGDSLIIVARGGKRTFVNRFTGKTVLPFKYDAAWSFYDGIAAVCQGDSVYFIDHSGKPINDKKFPRKREYGAYVYHGDYAAIPQGDKIGLVDKDGSWAVPPEYDDIRIGPKNLWSVKQDGKWGVIGADGQFVLPVEYGNIWIHADNGITVVSATDNSQSRYDYDGTLLDKFTCDGVHELQYAVNDVDEEGNQKYEVDSMLFYTANHYCGLMNSSGVPVTPPLYYNINCVRPGLYKCQLTEYSNDCVLLNSKGEKINS